MTNITSQRSEFGTRYLFDKVAIVVSGLQRSATFDCTAIVPPR
jgi:hypothetical protein